MMSELERIAYHEAGHALVSTRLGIPVRRVVLRSGSGSCTTDAAGAVAYTRLSDLVPRATAALLAGRVVERLLGFEPGEAGPDENKLIDLLRLHHRSARPTQAEADRVLEQGLARAELICRSEWGVVRKLADWLLRVQVLEPEHLATVLETASPEVLPAPMARLRELAKLAGDEPYLARSRPLEHLTRVSVQAEDATGCWAALEAEVAAYKPAPARLADRLPGPVAFSRPAPIHPRPSAPRRPAIFARPYPRGAA